MRECNCFFCRHVCISIYTDVAEVFFLERVMFSMQMLTEQTKSEMSYNLCGGYQTENVLLPQAK